MDFIINFEQLDKDLSFVLKKLDIKTDIRLPFTRVNTNKKVSYSDSINIKNTSENFEQTEFEREFKRNFASATKDKLVLYLLSLNDN